MSFYRTCPDCGAALDPTEACDCQKPLRPAPLVAGMTAQCAQAQRERATMARLENRLHERGQRRAEAAMQAKIKAQEQAAAASLRAQYAAQHGIGENREQLRKMLGRMGLNA